MKPSEDVINRFYQSIGKLFYAVAAADKVIHPKEYDKLLEIIKSDWLDLEDTEDEFGTDAAYQIQFTFDWLKEASPAPYDCFREFEDFKTSHEYVFPEDVKLLIWKTAYEIASAFSKRNKSELVILSKLALLLKREVVE